ncbi:MAG: FAD-binding oxidoreductase [Fimbriimonadaceae bacterium]|nr:FAD-binding oxidoreductase [Chthonomonadaceae bacterium]MCO5296576.1 FAD-binding oxidoreductase [Fimbriimonadaceae bacterium]
MRPFEDMHLLSGWFERTFRGATVNDIHSALNATKVDRVVQPKNVEEAASLVRRLAREGRSLSVAGGRHSMGGQQFSTADILLDSRRLNRVHSLNPETGLLSVEAGTQWPELLAHLKSMPSNTKPGWTFRQKQTGGDRMSLAGSLSSNIHSRGLTFRPFVDDIESLTLVGPEGEPSRIDRSNPLFNYAVGGYGLFGIVTQVELRLVKRHKLRRNVEIRPSEGILGAFDEKIASGYEYGDFQFAIDPASEDYLRKGVFSTYEPVAEETPIPAAQKGIPSRAFHHLVRLAHEDPTQGFELYARFYRATNDQIYWSDEHQMAPYLDGYHKKLDRVLGAACKGSEMISELYVPRKDLEAFLAVARTELRRLKAKVIYGTIRLIEAENETVLAWATQPWACIIFNLHLDHSPEGLVLARDQFRMLIDAAQSFGGSYYLTYHGWASKEQVLTSYPRLPEFLAEKKRRDPADLFTSNWYRRIHRLVE